MEIGDVLFYHLLNLLPCEPFEARGFPVVLGLRGEAELRPHGAEEVVVAEASAAEHVSWLHGDAALEARLLCQFSFGTVRKAHLWLARPTDGAPAIADVDIR